MNTEKLAILLATCLTIIPRAGFSQDATTQPSDTPPVAVRFDKDLIESVEIVPVKVSHQGLSSQSACESIAAFAQSRHIDLVNAERQDDQWGLTLRRIANGKVTKKQFLAASLEKPFTRSPFRGLAQRSVSTSNSAAAAPTFGSLVAGQLQVFDFAESRVKALASSGNHQSQCFFLTVDGDDRTFIACTDKTTNHRFVDVRLSPLSTDGTTGPKTQFRLEAPLRLPFGDVLPGDDNWNVRSSLVAATTLDQGDLVFAGHHRATYSRDPFGNGPSSLFVIKTDTELRRQRSLVLADRYLNSSSPMIVIDDQIYVVSTADMFATANQKHGWDIRLAQLDASLEQRWEKQICEADMLSMGWVDFLATGQPEHPLLLTTSVSGTHEHRIRLLWLSADGEVVKQSDVIFDAESFPIHPIARHAHGDGRTVVLQGYSLSSDVASIIVIKTKAIATHEAKASSDEH